MYDKNPIYKVGARVGPCTREPGVQMPCMSGAVHEGNRCTGPYKRETGVHRPCALCRTHGRCMWTSVHGAVLWHRAMFAGRCPLGRCPLSRCALSHSPNAIVPRTCHTDMYGGRFAMRGTADQRSAMPGVIQALTRSMPAWVSASTESQELMNWDTPADSS